MRSLRDARSQLYSNIINNSPANSKQLFSTNSLSFRSYRGEVQQLHHFFRKKEDNIRSLLSSSPVIPVPTVNPQPGISQPLCCFSDISQQEVENIIRKMKPSTCAMDPFPTSLVKSNLCAISPLITKVINHFLQAGHVPSTLKTAVIRPLLNKPHLRPRSP